MVKPHSETTAVLPPPLANGDHLTWEQFVERWEVMPEIKKAELINGVVYMSPLSYSSAQMEYWLIRWIGHYVDSTPGCETLSNTTFRMLEDAPQPDAFLRILEEYGGRSRVEGKFLAGVPELVAQACLTSAAYDLNEKKALYRRAGVQEYIVVLLHEKEIRWHRLEASEYQLVSPDAAGIYRSAVFPGLWLNSRSLLKGDMKEMLETLNEGLKSAEHATFVTELKSRRG